MCGKKFRITGVGGTNKRLGCMQKNSVIFEYKKSSRVEEKIIKKYLKKLKPEINRAQEAQETGYANSYGFVNSPSDTKALLQISSTVKKIKKLNPDILLLIGIGGSNLGTLAVHHALHGLFSNDKKPTIKFYCADTIDSITTHNLLTIIEDYLRAGKICIITIVTKSGTTTETIINAGLFFELLKKYYPKDFNNYIVITTDKDSSLWLLGEKNKFSLLEIPKNVGGRYSVFTAVGLFPLALLGIDIKKLCAGAQKSLELYLRTDLQNSAAVSAALIFAHYQKKIAIHDTFVFSPTLASLGAWYRQLMGESIGKKLSRSGKIVQCGITPTVSVGTIDLHSVAQLYLGGPRDRFTTFVTSQEESNQKIPATIFSYNTHYAGKSIAEIKKAIFDGVRAAYVHEKCPFVTSSLNGSEESIGNFLLFKMLEIVYLSYLLDVNPFDQPAVELYKSETRKLLGT